jgi:tRNA pseudouridine38-40 synthase
VTRAPRSEEPSLFDEPGAPSRPGPDPASLVRLRMTVAYDGSGFSGFAANPGVPTVGGTLETSLRRVLRSPVTLTCAGRTDAGVHARGQVVSFDAPADHPDPARIVQSVNRLCQGAIVVRDLEVAPPDFDARHSATARRYRYAIQAGPHPDPLRRRTTWWVPHELDLALLRLGCDPLIGEHDFSSFCRRPKAAVEVSLVRRVRDARWETGPDGLHWFWIEADAFCQQMVRSIVGTLVEVGAGRMRPGDLRAVLRARDRHAAGPMAPAHGLCLWEVRY